MQKFQITGPDGGTFEIEAPDGATEDQVLEFAKKNMGQPSPQPQVDNQPRPVHQIGGKPYDYGFTDEVANYATFGLSNKGANVGEWLADKMFGDGTSYADIAKNRRQAKELYREENPWKSGGASFVGGMGNPVANTIGRWAVGDNVLSGINKAVNTPTLSKILQGLNKEKWLKGLVRSRTDEMKELGLKELVKRGAVSGATLAGTQALGENIGDGLSGEELAGNVGGTTSFGLGLGAGLPPAIKGGAWLLQKFANTLARLPGSGKQQTTLAWRKIYEALERDGYTPDSAVQRLDELGPEATLADLGENMHALSYSVYSKPGKGSGKMRDFVEDRHKGVFPADDSAGVLEGGQQGRISDKIDELYPEQYQGKQNQPETSKLYTEAFAENKDIFSDKLDQILRTSSGKKALKEAVEIMSDEMERVGKSDPELTALYNDVYGEGTGAGVSSGLKLKTWDYVKRAFDDMIERATNKGDQPTVRRLAKLKNDLTGELDSLTGGAESKYARGRGLSSDDFANEDAFNFGQKFMRQDVRLDELQQKLANMTEEQLHNYRIGAMKQLKNDISKMKAGSDKAQQILDNKLLQRKIKTVFGDDQKFGEYMTLLKNEAQMSKLRKFFGGSQTEKKLSATEDFKVDPNRFISGVAKIKGSNWIGGVGDILGALGQKTFMRERTSRALSDALTGRDLTGVRNQYQAQELGQKVQQIMNDLALRGSIYGSNPNMQIQLKEIN